MDFKSIIRSQAEDLEAREKRERLISRERAQSSLEAIAHPNILAVTGVRRAGKSIFSYQLSKGRVSGRISFDDERLSGVGTADLDRILRAFYELYGDLECVVLDEIQQVPRWELFASRLRNRMRVIVTGSNATLLGGELATRLTGRYIDTVLFPFSFHEHLSSADIHIPEDPTTSESAAVTGQMEAYLRDGGFPEARTIGRGILPRIFGDIVSKDIVARHKVRHAESLHALAGYLVGNAATEITVKRLSATLGLKSQRTASKWIAWLEQAFLVFELERFSYKMRERHLAPRKIFCVDNGLVSALSSGFSENNGRLMENLVAVELRRRSAPEYGSAVYYWKDHQQREVDFVVKGRSGVERLIQVTYAGDRNDIRGREIESLLKASAELRCRALMVITWDHEEESSIDGRNVVFKPLWKWLLEGPEAVRGSALANARSRP